MNLNITKVKICVMVPVGKTDEIRKIMFDLGAGEIGTNYKECSNVVKCIGTFKPINNAKPYIGKKDKLEFVNEEKLEVICKIEKVKKVVKKLREVHPYEEPAIDIIPLLDEDSL